MATIVQVNGSIPSYESAKMLVREDGSMMGTVGGGCVEAEVWNAAREVIETEKPRHLILQPGPGRGLRQRPDLRRAIEHFRRARDSAAARLHFRRRARLQEHFEGRRRWPASPRSIIDNREAFANRERFPEAEATYAEEYEDVFPKLPMNSSSYMIIVTRGHRDDMRVLRWAVNTPAQATSP